MRTEAMGNVVFALMAVKSVTAPDGQVARYPLSPVYECVGMLVGVVSVIVAFCNM